MIMNKFFIIQLVLFIALFVIIIFLLRNIIANRKASRIKYYSLKPIKNEEISFSERIVNSYLSFVKKFRKLIKKSNYFVMRSKKYEKYIKYKDRDRIQNVDFITNKFIISIIFILLTTISQIFTTKSFSFFGYIINYFIGYYLLDFLLFLNYKRKTRNIENDLLRAIIIMNNCFKAGKSTLQALKVASDELPYPLGDEFKKMYLDMKYGLSIDTVFERFARRVNIDEAIYLSSSLTILNKTGGNIVEVFSSIERTLFDKKKLKEEMKNISAAPKVVVIILSIIPIIFVFIVYLLNPMYFNPLFNSVLGYIIISIIIIMFIIYLILLLKTLKVDE